MTNLRAGNVSGVAKAVSVGARIAKDKLAGLEQENILVKYGRELGLTEADIEQIRRKRNRRG